MASQFQVYKDKAGEYRWRLLAKNNQIIAQSSGGYTSKTDAIRGTQILSEKGLGGSPQVYQADDGFRFRYTARNGNIIAVGEVYKRAEDASHAVTLLHELAPEAPVVDKTTYPHGSSR